VNVDGHALKQALRRGCERATREHPLRSSVVHPLTRKNEHTSCGIEVPVIHVDFSNVLEELVIEMIPKGSGSENNSFLKMAIPAEGIDAIKTFVIDCVIAAGAKTCPPPSSASELAALPTFASLLPSAPRPGNWARAAAMPRVPDWRGNSPRR
jgi:tartrate/fumarate subfamily iron-sulfur-dependent hydro-lyase alpha chain